MRRVAGEGWRVIIAIDELDKMGDDTEAMKFLNHIKVLFPIHDCSFIVSVSEDAWARYESRGIPLRDTFDSSFDEVVLVEMMRPLESRDFLKRRSNSITDTQALLCHCLAGGLPRDLLRAVRLLARMAGKVQGSETTRPPGLEEVLAALLQEDLEAKLRAFDIRRGGGRTASGLTTPWSLDTSTGHIVRAIGDFSAGSVDGYPFGGGGIQLSPATRTGYMFAPGDSQVQQFSS
ncbi:MAG: hypothetical protein ACRDRJ_10080 [Streptosporangiaceae bacterium]